MLSFFKKIFGGDKKYITLESEEFEQQLRDTSRKKILLDVRSKHEFDELKIPNALNIDIMNPNFKNRLSKMDKQKPYFVYCQSGRRSAKACKVLTELGYEQVYNLKGGISGYDGRVV